MNYLTGSLGLNPPTADMIPDLTTRRAVIVWNHLGFKIDFPTVLQYYRRLEKQELQMTPEHRFESQMREMALLKVGPLQSRFLEQLRPNLYHPVTVYRYPEQLRRPNLPREPESYDAYDLEMASNMITAYCQHKNKDMKTFLREYCLYAQEQKINPTMANVAFYLQYSNTLDDARSDNFDQNTTNKFNTLYLGYDPGNLCHLMNKQESVALLSYVKDDTDSEASSSSSEPSVLDRVRSSVMSGLQEQAMYSEDDGMNGDGRKCISKTFYDTQDLGQGAQKDLHKLNSRILNIVGDVEDDNLGINQVTFKECVQNLFTKLRAEYESKTNADGMNSNSGTNGNFCTIHQPIRHSSERRASIPTSDILQNVFCRTNDDEHDRKCAEEKWSELIAETHKSLQDETKANFAANDYADKSKSFDVQMNSANYLREFPVIANKSRQSATTVQSNREKSRMIQESPFTNIKPEDFFRAWDKKAVDKNASFFTTVKSPEKPRADIVPPDVAYRLRSFWDESGGTQDKHSWSENAWVPLKQWKRCGDSMCHDNWQTRPVMYYQDVYGLFDFRETDDTFEDTETFDFIEKDIKMLLNSSDESLELDSMGMKIDDYLDEKQETKNNFSKQENTDILDTMGDHNNEKSNVKKDFINTITNGKCTKNTVKEPADKAGKTLPAEIISRKCEKPLKIEISVDPIIEVSKNHINAENSTTLLKIGTSADPIGIDIKDSSKPLEKEHRNNSLELEKSKDSIIIEKTTNEKLEEAIKHEEPIQIGIEMKLGQIDEDSSRSNSDAVNIKSHFAKKYMDTASKNHLNERVQLQKGTSLQMKNKASVWTIITGQSEEMKRTENRTSKEVSKIGISADPTTVETSKDPKIVGNSKYTIKIGNCSEPIVVMDSTKPSQKEHCENLFEFGKTKGPKIEENTSNFTTNGKPQEKIYHEKPMKIGIGIPIGHIDKESNQLNSIAINNTKSYYAKKYLDAASKNYPNERVQIQIGMCPEIRNKLCERIITEKQAEEIKIIETNRKSKEVSKIEICDPIVVEKTKNLRNVENPIVIVDSTRTNLLDVEKSRDPIIVEKTTNLTVNAIPKEAISNEEPIKIGIEMQKGQNSKGSNSDATNKIKSSFVKKYMDASSKNYPNESVQQQRETCLEMKNKLSESTIMTGKSDEIKSTATGPCVEPSFLKVESDQCKYQISKIDKAQVLTTSEDAKDKQSVTNVQNLIKKFIEQTRADLEGVKKKNMPRKMVYDMEVLEKRKATIGDKSNSETIETSCSLKDKLATSNETAIRKSNPGIKKNKKNKKNKNYEVTETMKNMYLQYEASKTEKNKAKNKLPDGKNDNDQQTDFKKCNTLDTICNCFSSLMKRVSPRTPVVVNLAASFGSFKIPGMKLFEEDGQELEISQKNENKITSIVEESKLEDTIVENCEVSANDDVCAKNSQQDEKEENAQTEEKLSEAIAKVFQNNSFDGKEWEDLSKLCPDVKTVVDFIHKNYSEDNTTLQDVLLDIMMKYKSCNTWENPISLTRLARLEQNMQQLEIMTVNVLTSLDTSEKSDPLIFSKTFVEFANSNIQIANQILNFAVIINNTMNDILSDKNQSFSDSSDYDTDDDSEPGNFKTLEEFLSTFDVDKYKDRSPTKSSNDGNNGKQHINGDKIHQSNTVVEGAQFKDDSVSKSTGAIRKHNNLLNKLAAEKDNFSQSDDELDDDCTSDGFEMIDITENDNKQSDGESCQALSKNDDDELDVDSFEFVSSDNSDCDYIDTDSKESNISTDSSGLSFDFNHFDVPSIQLLPPSSQTGFEVPVFELL